MPQEHLPVSKGPLLVRGDDRYRRRGKGWEKLCSYCHEWKDVSEFYKNYRDAPGYRGIDTWCKGCCAIHAARRRRGL